MKNPSNAPPKQRTPALYRNDSVVYARIFAPAKIVVKAILVSTVSSSDLSHRKASDRCHGGEEVLRPDRLV